MEQAFLLCHVKPLPHSHRRLWPSRSQDFGQDELQATIEAAINTLNGFIDQCEQGLQALNAGCTA